VASSLNYQTLTYEQLAEHTVDSFTRLTINDEPLLSLPSATALENIKEDLKVEAFLQAVAYTIHCMEGNKKLPLEYLSRVSLINSRIHNLNNLKYQIICQGLVTAIADVISENVSLSYIDNYLEDYKSVLNKFLLQFVNLLLRLSEDPQLDPRTNGVLEAEKTISLTSLRKSSTFSTQISTTDSCSQLLLLISELNDINSLYELSLHSATASFEGYQKGSQILGQESVDTDSNTYSQQDVDSRVSTSTDKESALESGSDIEHDYTHNDEEDNSYEFMNIFDTEEPEEILLPKRKKSTSSKRKVGSNANRALPFTFAESRKNRTKSTNSVSKHRLSTIGKKGEDCVIT
jgi:hypothetical protein